MFPFPPPTSPENFFQHRGPSVSCSSWDLSPFCHSAPNSFLTLSVPSISHSLFPSPHRQKKSGSLCPQVLLLRCHAHSSWLLTLGGVPSTEERPGVFAAEGSRLPQELPSLRSSVASLLPHSTDTTVLIFLDALLLLTLGQLPPLGDSLFSVFFHSTDQSSNSCFLSNYYMLASGACPKTMSLLSEFMV